MHAARTGFAALLFCAASLVFNWPLVGLFLDDALFAAYLGIFGALALLVLGLALIARGGEGPDDGRPGGPGQER